MEPTIMGYTGTTRRIHAFIPSELKAQIKHRQAPQRCEPWAGGCKLERQGVGILGFRPGGLLPVSR